jgi:hypothetical protein
VGVSPAGAWASCPRILGGSGTLPPGVCIFGMGRPRIRPSNITTQTPSTVLATIKVTAAVTWTLALVAAIAAKPRALNSHRPKTLLHSYPIFEYYTFV